MPLHSHRTLQSTLQDKKEIVSATVDSRIDGILYFPFLSDSPPLLSPFPRSRFRFDSLRSRIAILERFIALSIDTVLNLSGDAADLFSLSQPPSNFLERNVELGLSSYTEIISSYERNYRAIYYYHY